MSSPITETCEYCGSPDVMDDAWWCDAPACCSAYDRECEKTHEYEERIPLTRRKADIDLVHTEAFVYGPSALNIEFAASMIASRSDATWRRFL